MFAGAKRCPHCRHQLYWNTKAIGVWAVAAVMAVLVGFAVSAVMTTGDGSPPMRTFGNP